MNNYKKLEEAFDSIANIQHVDAICSWDEAVMMPKGGGATRANALAYLHGLLHEKLISETIAELIFSVDTKLLDDWQLANFKLMKREHQLASAVPNQLVKKRTQKQIECEQAWRILRKENDWKAFKPLLNEVFILSKEVQNYKAQAFQLSCYDMCLDEFSPGLSQAIIDPIFTKLKNDLPNLIASVIEKQKQQELSSLSGSYPIEKQRELAKTTMELLGFDFDHGRFDVSHHPFCGGVSDDVRITTRFNEKEFVSALMGICHETGHGLYELGLPKKWKNQPVGKALGMAMHESQSLLMEMQACRSHEFMLVLSPMIKKYFGESALYDANHLYQHYTRVKRDYIRVDADEMTYPLHVILRYEIEKDLFNDALIIDHLPDVWDAKMQHYLGLSTKGNFADGLMQDVHWACGLFGYFPAYTIGALIAAQIFNAANNFDTGIMESISKGNFTRLNHWLKNNVHQKASSKSFLQLLQDATGEQLNPDYFIKHIKTRYEIE
jgi:carboxypeptidase Taq